MGSSIRGVEPGTLARPVVELGDGRLLAGTAHGFPLIALADDSDVTPSLVAGGQWEPALTQWILERLGAGETFVDVGAHIGYFTVLAAHRTGPRGHVVAVEPHAVSARLLAQNLYINGVIDRVRVAPCAAGRAPGRRTLYSKEDHAAGATLHGDVAPGPWTQVEIATVPLDELLEGVPCRGAIVKIDAEGSEPAIWDGMRGLIERHGDTLLIAMEFCPLMILGAREDPRTFLGRVRSDGFVPHLLTPQGQIERLTDEQLLARRIETLLLARDAARVTRRG